MYSKALAASPHARKPPAPTKATKVSIVGGLIGVFIELYDNAVYGFVAGTLAVVFFPSDAPTTWACSIPSVSSRPAASAAMSSRP